MSTRVLFVGNSFVSRNDVPGMVRELAASAGQVVETASVVAGGASLRRHLNAGTVARALAQGQWSHVVLQEQSTLPIKNPLRYHENVRALHPLIVAAGAATVLYMTWARRWAPQSQEEITSAVQVIATELGCAIAPAGLAWQAVEASHPEIGLYAADGSHPTVAGSFLAACVLYGIIFQDPHVRVVVPVALNMGADVSGVLVDAAREALRDAGT